MNLRYRLDVTCIFPCAKVVIFVGTSSFANTEFRFLSAAMPMRRHISQASASKLCPATHGFEESFPLRYTRDAESARFLFLDSEGLAPGKSPGRALHAAEAVG